MNSLKEKLTTQDLRAWQKKVRNLFGVLQPGEVAGSAFTTHLSSARWTPIVFIESGLDEREWLCARQQAERACDHRWGLGCVQHVIMGREGNVV